MQTRFVLVLDGATNELRIVRYDPEKHGYWPDLPDVNESPPQLLEQVTGFGEGIIPIGQQFQSERKAHGGASRKYAPVRHNPKPRKPR